MQLWLVHGLLILIRISITTPHLVYLLVDKFGPITNIFPRPLTSSFKYFAFVFKTNAHGAKFPATLHFVRKYKIPWILRWRYVKDGGVLARQWLVKWWDKFSNTQDVIDNVTRDLPINPTSQVRAQALAYLPY